MCGIMLIVNVSQNVTSSTVCRDFISNTRIARVSQIVKSQIAHQDTDGTMESVIVCQIAIMMEAALMEITGITLYVNVCRIANRRPALMGITGVWLNVSVCHLARLGIAVLGIIGTI